MEKIFVYLKKESFFKKWLKIRNRTNAIIRPTIIVNEEGSVPKLNLDCKEILYEPLDRFVKLFSVKSASASAMKKIYIAAIDKLKDWERLSVFLNFE